MQFTTIVAFALAATASVHGVPLQKRIAQVIADSTTKWEQACDAAGGGAKCNQVAVASFGTLLAAPGPCEQQNAADNMVDLAKTLNNDANMIKFAQIFAQQPRNSPTSQSVPYCQSAPRNAELKGLFQCQFQGDNPKTFVGGTAVGGAGTIPFGMNAPLNPAGSCPANPSGPIADGSQLVDLTQNPGVGGSTSSASTTGGSTGNSTVVTPSSDATSSTPSAAVATVAASPVGAIPSTTPASGGGGFKLSNGQSAQKLNAQFATLTAASSCTANTNACVGGAFAQCVGGKFMTTPCGSGLTCAALPLVNSPGTSITCTTTADAEARIAATGAQGGITGSG